MTVMHLVFSTAAFAAASAFAGPELPGGWAPKFYHGLEAVGSVETLPSGFKGKDASIRLKWESGAMKFFSPRSTAYFLQGHGVRSRPRPAGRSGCVTTPTTCSWASLRMPFRHIAEASDDPMKTILI